MRTLEPLRRLWNLVVLLEESARVGKEAATQPEHEHDPFTARSAFLQIESFF